MTQSDNAGHLIRAARKGDTEAFGQLVQRHQDMVWRLALARSGSIQHADEIAQDVFVTAWRRLHTLRAVDRFGPWLRQITRNLADRSVRARLRRARRDAQAPPVAAAPTPEEVALRADDRRLVEGALARLPEADRELLIASYREGLSATAVAADLGISPAAARQRLTRARSRLREEVDSQLAASLDRSRPGAAFAAGVLTALPRPRPWLVGVGLAVSCAVLILTAMWALSAIGGFEATPAEPDTSATRSEPRPAQTQRSASASAIAATPSPDPVDTDGAPFDIRDYGQDVEAVVIVDLREPLEAWRSNQRESTHLDPASFFPRMDEAPLPDVPGAELLQRLLDLEAAREPAGRAELHRDLLATAPTLEEVDEEDPWALLFAVEVARRRSRAEFRKTYAEHSARRREASASELARLDAQRPTLHNATVVSRLEAALADDTNSPAEDYLRLYLLDARFDLLGESLDVEAGLDLAVDLLQHAEDAVLRERAASQIADQRDLHTLTERDLGVIEEAWPSLPRRQQGRVAHALSVLRLERGELARAAIWAGHRREQLTEACGRWHTVSPLDSDHTPIRTYPDGSHLCGSRTLESDRLQGRLDHGLGTPSPHWRAAFAAAAWACEEAHQGQGESLWRGRAEPGHGLVWSSGKGPFGRCLSEAWEALAERPKTRAVMVKVSRRAGG